MGRSEDLPVRSRSRKPPRPWLLLQPRAVELAPKRTRSRSVVFATPLLTFVVTDGLFRVFRVLFPRYGLHRRLATFLVFASSSVEHLCVEDVGARHIALARHRVIPLLRQAPLWPLPGCLSNPSGTACQGRTSRSARVVSHHLDGFLHTRVAGLLRPATGHGVVSVSTSCLAISRVDDPSASDRGFPPHRSPLEDVPTHSRVVSPPLRFPLAVGLSCLTAHRRDGVRVGPSMLRQCRPVGW